jgi:hypothetical protein
MAYYNDAGGLYIGVHDPDGNPKYLGPVQTNANKSTVLDFSPELCLPEQVGNSYFPSFDYILGCFKGDWQDAADIYKKWSVKQSWCEKTIKERNDIPDWVKKGAFFFNFRLRGQSKGVDYLKSVPEYCKKWQDVLGVPLVAMMCGWEKIGEWIGPDYFPPYGEDLFKEMCIKLKEAGIHPFPFGLSGLKLPIRKKINRDWPQSELVIDYNNRETFKNKYRCHAALDSNGSLISDSAVESWDGLHAYACVSTSQARDQIYNASLRLINEYEVRICQADQMLGGSVPECYNPGHDHPPGRGSWQVNMLRQIYADTRKDAKKKEAGFALSQEYPSELYLQYLDVCHGRVYEQPRGLIGVPLFAYLYHEYLPCYGGDWSSMLDDNTCGVYVQASNFVYGSLPAGCSQSMFKNMKNELPENCNPDIIDMAKNTSSLFIRFPQYLLLGKMCKTPALNIPEIRVEMMGLNTSGWGKSPLMVPSVLHCLWQSPDGNRAYTLANISSENRVIRFQESDASGGAVLWINKNNAKNLTPVNNNIQFTLEPLDAGILELKA